MDLVAGPRGRRLVFAALYLSEGGPIGFLWWALPTLLRLQGVAIERITALTAAITLPWTLKFLAAPLVDLVRSPRFGHRAWILAAQAVMGLTLLPLAWLDLGADFGLVFALLLAHASAAAMQDVAIDAWVIARTPEDEHGRVNGWMQAGMLLGRWAFGSGVLLLSPHAGRAPVILALVGLVWSSSLLVLLSREVEAPARGRDRLQQFGAALREVGRSRVTWLGLAFALTAGAGFEAVGALAGPFLVDAGAGEERVGLFYSLSVVAMLAGALLGGRWSDRFGHVRVAGAGLLGLALSIACVSLLADRPVGVFLALVATYAGIGVFTAASYALFMDSTDRRLGATQFSTYMAATNACEAWAGFSVGRLVAPLGFAGAFLVMALLSLVALAPLRGLRSRSSSPDEAPLDEGPREPPTAP